MRLTEGSDSREVFQGKVPTSLDSMSPKNPGLLAMVEIPVLPPIKAHSIISSLGQRRLPAGTDGVVSYQSAQWTMWSPSSSYAANTRARTIRPRSRSCGASCTSICNNHLWLLDLLHPIRAFDSNGSP